LLKEVFDRAGYGCKLFCLWCAQDLDANYFWESLGFIPLAFRTGASGKRTHIFWQRRIREGDTTTPYWFPSKTDGGMMREDRLVLPIPPGVHWKDAMPCLLPQEERVSGLGFRVSGEKQKSLTGSSSRTPKPEPRNPTRRRVQFGPPSDGPEPVVEKVKLGKPAKPKREKVKADPVHVAKARELRDRYLEQFNAGQVLPSAKYEVSRALVSPSEPALEVKPRAVETANLLAA
jgi:hypothetical protein